MAARDRLQSLYTNFAATLALVACWSVFSGGVPLLRHDWRTPLVQSAVGPWLASFSQPWLPAGAGQPQPYPTLYLIGFALWPFHALVNAYDVLIFIVGGTVFLAVSAAIRISRNTGVRGAIALIPGSVAVLNPWVYSEFVAGHIFMVLAYAIVLALFAEVTRGRPRTVVITILAAFSIIQIEFFLVTLLPLAYWCFRTARPKPLTAMCLAALPIVIGIAAQYNSVRATPYALAWQQAQSVPIPSGVALLGYTFNYGAAFFPFRFALDALAIMAALGIIMARRSQTHVIAGLIALIVLAYASGTTSWFSIPYSWLVLHVPESGVFRELYDLIAFVGVAYVVGLSCVLARVRHGAFALAAASAAAILIVPWLAHPVSSFFVRERNLGNLHFPADPEHRIALFPAYQPMSLGGHGSGFDPDLFIQSGAALPVNEFAPAYPVDAALSYAWYDRDFTMLRALSVTDIVTRRTLRTDWKSVRYQQALLIPPPADAIARRVRAPTIVSMTSGEPGVTSDPQDLWSNSRFMTAGVQMLRPLGTIDFKPRSHWIDSRLAELSRPEWATRAAGIVTTGLTPITIPQGTILLAQISGRLVTDAQIQVGRASSRLKWWPLPRNVRSLRCIGVCMLSLIGSGEPPRVPRAASWADVRSHSITPWAYSVAIPGARAVRTLRFAEQYDDYWAAYAGGRTLPHVRLNDVFNAWILPAGFSGRIVLVERLAFWQTAAELAALLGIASLALWPVRRANE